jgi:hypothetical protein
MRFKASSRHACTIVKSVRRWRDDLIEAILILTDFGTLTWCIEYAAKRRRGADQLLDELDRAASKLAAQPYRRGQNFLETFGNQEEESDRHWTCTLFKWTTGTSFLYLAAMCDLHGYMEAKLSPDYFEPPQDERTPFLLVAVSEYEILSRYTQKPFCSRPVPRAETVRAA